MIDDPHPHETVPPAGTMDPQPATPAETPVGETAPAETAPAETAPAETAATETAAAETPVAEMPVAEMLGTEAATTGKADAETPATQAAAAETPPIEATGAAEDAPPPGPGSLREPDEDSLRVAEALVFASAEPVTPRGLARVLPDHIDADAVLRALQARYAGRGVELVEAGNGVMFRSALDLAPRLRKVIDAPRRLPRVAMETLAIVAYHQPMTRPEIEHIRGTALSQQTLDSLLELNLIAPKGRRETPGRPTLWGTTPEFLAHFGLKDLRELPRREDLLLETAPPKPVPDSIPADLQPPPPRVSEDVPGEVPKPGPERPAEPG
jgi:segregation and condensation protein B